MFSARTLHNHAAGDLWPAEALFALFRLLRPETTLMAAPAANGLLTGVNPDEGPQLSYRIGYQPYSDQGDYQYDNRGDMDL